MDSPEEDVIALWKSMKHEERLVKQKRRWLMGLPKDLKMSGRLLGRLRDKFFFSDQCVPESFLRADDVFPQLVKDYLETKYQVFIQDSGIGHSHHLSYLFGNRLHFLGEFFSILDDLNTRTLLNIADIVTNNSMEFAKSRSSLIRVIREYSPAILDSSKRDEDFVMHYCKISQLLMNPANYKEHHLPAWSNYSVSCHAAIEFLLSKIDKFPGVTLIAMETKLKQLPPLLKMQKSQQTGKRLCRKLITSIRKHSEEFLLRLSNGDRLPASLTKALRVASLHLKQVQGNTRLPFLDFSDVSDDLDMMQNEILKATWHVQNVPFSELEEIQVLCDPEVPDIILSSRATRAEVRSFLIECLFHCDDIHLPDSVMRAISIINTRYSNPSSPRKDLQSVSQMQNMNEELEYVLTASSCMKQVVWDHLDCQSVDHAFCSAYMEDGNGSDHGNNENDGCSNDNRRISNVINGVSVDIDDCSESEHVAADFAIEGHSYAANSSPVVENLQHRIENSTSNEYLKIQTICDDTSLLAHQLIGCLMEKLLAVEGKKTNPAVESYLCDIPVLEHENAPGRSLKLGSTTKGKRSTEHCSYKEETAFMQVIDEMKLSLPESRAKKLKKLFMST